MTTRTDIHRPSAITPAEYRFVGVTHQAGTEHLGHIPFIVQQARVIAQHMHTTSGVYSDHSHKGNCMVCGAHCQYMAVYYHSPSNSYIRTGFDCADKIGSGDKNLFKRAQQAVGEARERLKGKTKAESVLKTAGLEDAWKLYLILEDTPRFARSLGFDPNTPMGILSDFAQDEGLPLADLLLCLSNSTQRTRDESTLCDIIGKLAKYGSLTPKQLDFLKVLSSRCVKRPEVEAKRVETLAKREEEKAALPDIIEGRYTLEVVVLKTELRDNGIMGYGRDTSRTVMTVKTPTGNIMWGTVPSSCLRVTVGGEERPLQKGDKLSLTATITRSHDDPKFGIFKRPSGKPIN